MTTSTQQPRPQDQQMLEERRRMALRHVRQYPDPVLRRAAHPVEDFDAELSALGERMTNIMREAQGVGLAAPQLGLVLRVFTYQLGEGEEPGVVVNPEITKRSDETEIADEGCLSLGEVGVPVERAVAVTVKAQDLDGNDVEHDLEGFGARVFQHEIDHLDGVLMIDRAVDDAARKSAMAYLRPHP